MHARRGSVQMGALHTASIPSTPGRLDSLFAASPGRFRFSERRQMLQKQYDKTSEVQRPRVKRQGSLSSASQISSDNKSDSGSMPSPPLVRIIAARQRMAAEMESKKNERKIIDRPALELSPEFRNEDFVGEFDPVQFSEQIMRPVFTHMSSEVGDRNGAVFDASHLQELFDNSLQSLTSMIDNLDMTIEGTEFDTEQAEGSYKDTLNSNEKIHASVLTHFRLVESGINSVADTAVRIGERLNNVNKQKERAEEAGRLVKYFLDFNKDYDEDEEQLYLDEVFIDPDYTHEAAVLARKLYSVVQSMNLDRTRLAKRHIVDYCSRLESTLLNEFYEASVSNNIDQMRRCAETLHEFNDGSSCIHTYVTSRKMFFDINQVLSEGGVPSNSLADQEETERELTQTFNEIKFVVEHESCVINEVFPKPTAVMRLLVERIFEQRVADCVRNSLKPFHGVHYLRVLAKSRDLSYDLVDTLSKYDVGPNFNWPHLLVSLFTPYCKSYISKELLSLKALFASEIASGTRKESRSDSKSDKRFSRKILSVAHLSKDKWKEGAPSFSALICDKFVDWTEESVRRCEKLSDEGELTNNVTRIFILLLGNLFNDYVNVVFKSSLKDLSEPETGGLKHMLGQRDMASLGSDDGPDLQPFLNLVSQTTATVQKIQKFLHSVIIASLQVNVNSVNAVTQCLQHMSNAVRGLEEKVIEGLKSCLNSSMEFIEASLSAFQKKSDYKPKDEVIDVTVTSACSQVCCYLSKVENQVRSSLTGRNVDNLLTRLGSEFYSILCKHIKGFSISYLGGIKLKRDITEYQERLRSFGSHVLDEKLEDLMDISNIFLVPAEGVASIVEESRLSKVDRREVMSFIRLRADFKTAKISEKFPNEHSVKVNRSFLFMDSRGFSVADFTCPICLSLLYKPTVNSCGHAFCFWCRFQAMDPFTQSKCPVCRANYTHFPRVCGVLNETILKLFPNESQEREKDFKVLQEEMGCVPDEMQASEYFKSKNSGLNLNGGEASDEQDRLKEEQVNDEQQVDIIDNDGLLRNIQIDAEKFVHFGVGCDGCGVFPICGKRYKCKDCMPVCGFDLCAECFYRGVASSGRFSQGHTQDHRVEVVVGEQTILHSLQAIHEGELDISQIIHLVKPQLEELRQLGVIVDDLLESEEEEED